MAVIPLAPTLAVLAAAALAARFPARWSRALAVVGAVGALAAVLGTRSLWEADVRRVVFIASQAKGAWLDRAVDLLLASCGLTLAAALRASRAGYAVAVALAAASLLCGWLAG